MAAGLLALVSARGGGAEAAANGWPPFIASWAFQEHVTVGPDGRQEVAYSVREETQVLRVERLMPPQYRGEPRYDEFKKSAAFVTHLRRKYKTVADRILGYLLESTRSTSGTAVASASAATPSSTRCGTRRRTERCLWSRWSLC